jgi:uncharacterized FlgJ-related protein
MTSRDVINYLNVEGMDKLYKKFEKYFTEVDTWADRFATGDLLNEYELSQALDRMTGIYIRFHIISEALDSYKTNKELDFKVKAFRDAEAKDKKPTISQIEEEARASSKDLRTYRGDFQAYSDACEKAIITCQARLKRLTVESGAKGINFTGDVNQPAVSERNTQQDVGWSA